LEDLRLLHQTATRKYFCTCENDASLRQLKLKVAKDSEKDMEDKNKKGGICSSDLYSHTRYGGANGGSGNNRIYTHSQR